jgi:hypothetical protein
MFKNGDIVKVVYVRINKDFIVIGRIENEPHLVSYVKLSRYINKAIGKITKIVHVAHRNEIMKMATEKEKRKFEKLEMKYEAQKVAEKL